MHKIAILIVEDDKEVAHNLQLYLSHTCKVVDVAFNGKEAFNRYLEYSYDCIISDIEMPLTDGITLFQKIRSLDPFIILMLFSGHTQEKYLLEMLTLKLDGYVMKPITSRKIDEMLECILNHNKKEAKVICSKQGIVYSYLSKRITCKELCVSLSHFEIIVMELFLNDKYFIISHEALIEALYGNAEGSRSRLKNLIKRLRQKILFLDIKSLVGVGYQLVCQGKVHG
jgi:DNA-binding response OmpR family regulator